jgi:hypothetical protein
VTGNQAAPVHTDHVVRMQQWIARHPGSGWTLPAMPIRDEHVVTSPDLPEPARRRSLGPLADYEDSSRRSRMRTAR